MTISQCVGIKPIPFSEAVRLWHKRDIYIIEDDDSETLANDVKGSYPEIDKLYGIDRRTVLAVGHGDEFCTMFAGETVLDNGNGYCTLCGARIVTWADVAKWCGPKV